MSERLPVIGVVGAGTMGAGIAQLALENGHQVVLHDVDEQAIARGRARIREGLARRAGRLELDADSSDEWVAGRLIGLRDAHTLDALGAEAELVIEAALEDLQLKRTIFRALDAAAGPAVILATNTSALSVTAIATATTRPERVLGLHFFNPAPLMTLVEVVAAPATDPGIVERAETLMAEWGKTPVRSADSPGFIVNRVNRPFTLEAMAMIETGEASVEAVDAAMRAAGFPMGPFELMDLVGIDVNLAATTGIWGGFEHADRFRPSSIQERLVADGRLGRKVGSGFYHYDGDRRGEVEAEFAGRHVRLDDAVVVNRIVLAIVAEAWRALGDGVASPADIDLALRLGAGHPMGPFEQTTALGGPDAVLESLRGLRTLGPRFEPPQRLVGAARRPTGPTIEP